MKSLPKISIVIPSYNKVKYIKETLNSIFSQNYPNLEVIIQDGGSTDGTVEIIKECARRYPKIISWTSKKDKGQVDAINKGLKKAIGDVVTYINADDVYERETLLKVGEHFSNHPKTSWLVGKGRVIDKNGKEITSWVTKYKNFLLTINRYLLLLMVNYLMQPAVFLNKEVYRECGPFTGTKNFVLEYELWLRLGRIKMPTVINDFLASFRLTTGNISATQFKDILNQDFKIAKKYTSNFFILLLHKLHNWGRVLIVTDESVIGLKSGDSLNY